ncbi:Histone-lysine N-methyltransferase ash1 [Cladobotryum mycophilum]|uniref:Histone-lysine N-methyltransferase ash1 n=1 Tax=Cladobotryum mycophilum TaxID=491253 RepID=A0ABR0T3G2_9HYPO
MSLFAESSFSAPATDDSSNIASSSSTPPTTVADSASLHSDASKHEVISVVEHVAPSAAPIVTADDVPSPRRARRARASSPIYNLSKLSGTSAHGRRRSKGDIVSNRRRRTISGDGMVDSIELGAGGAQANNNSSNNNNNSSIDGVAKTETIDALDLQCSPARPNTPRSRRQARSSPRNLRSSSRLAGPSATSATTAPVSSLPAKLSAMSKRNRKSVDNTGPRMTRELRRLQDTKEFAHIDDIPVVHTVWSNGKYINPTQATEPPARKRIKAESPEVEIKKEEEPEPIIPPPRKRKFKKYLTRGLYSGQEYPKDVTRCLSTVEKKALAQFPELQPSGRVNKIMPSPIFTGLRLLLTGRDFKLPYNICNPLPPGQPKPDEWKKMTKNRFIGESKDIWRKMPHMDDYQSKCVCLPEDGCAESCQNRIMLYECDETNCNIGKEHCTNRAFADLMTRRGKGGKYRVGVEVIKTSDRGYGVRSNRCFEPHQIITEYTGEIITEEECERRMNEIYKNNECYYLMSFDQNMIIDATTGSVARFVNHSCNPNCRMIKWIVSGQPRMALFAGDKPIMTGDELTYDYNFDPFSAKNVQKCLCGQPNCRGVLGPRPREVKPPKADKNDLKNAVKATVKAGKRKLKELVGNEETRGDAKKRKVQPAKSVTKSLSNASLKAAKGAATAIRKGVSAMTTNKKTTSLTKVTAAVRVTASSISKKKKTTTTSSTKRVVKTYGSTAAARTKQTTLPSMLARREELVKAAKKSSPKKVAPMKKKTAAGKRTTSQLLAAD